METSHTGASSLAVSRRRALGIAASAGAAALLAACGGEAAPTAPAAAPAAAPTMAVPPTVAAPTTMTAAAMATAPAMATAAPAMATATTGITTAAPATVAATAADAAMIRVPNSGAMLPTEKLTFRWIDSGDLKALFYKKYFAAYQAAHPNVTIQYDALAYTEINKIVPTGIQGGNAHDVFAIPQGVTGAQVVREGWVRPLDDIVPNFAQWKATFPYGSFVEGVHVFGGKTYTFPVSSAKRSATMLFYNTDYMQQAGMDPAARPMTWDEFRAAARKLTQQGAGKYYGLIVAGSGADVYQGFVSNLARMAGASAGSSNIDWRTGEHAYATDQYLAVIDLLLALKADGSILPGSASLNTADARSKIPTGAAAMILEGPWNIPQWPRENPMFNFNVTSQPVPNNGKPVPFTVEEIGANLNWVFAKSKYPQVAGDMFSYIGGEEGQTSLVIATGGNLRAVLPGANERARRTQLLDPKASRALALYEEQLRLGPQPEVRNPEAALVALEMRTVTPSFSTTLQGLMTGQLRDPRKEMQDLKARSDAELDRAIKAAQMKGAKVSRDDWKFANWDPARDYTEADYAALKK